MTTSITPSKKPRFRTFSTLAFASLGLFSGCAGEGSGDVADEPEVASTTSTLSTIPDYDIYDGLNGPPTQCTMGGITMHCCPLGTAIIGVHADANVFKCGYLNAAHGVRTLDVGTVRNNMHACPLGQVMVGLNISANRLICETLPGVSVSLADEAVDPGPGGAPLQDGFPMHVCPTSNPFLSGIHAGENKFTCMNGTYQPGRTLALGPCSALSYDPVETSADLACVCTGQNMSGTCTALRTNTGSGFGALDISGAGHIFPSGKLYLVDGSSIADNGVRSIMTGANVRTRICYDPGFGSNCTDIRPSSTLNTLSAGTKSPGQATSDLNVSYDRQISSFRVDRIKGGVARYPSALTDCRQKSFVPPPGFFAIYSDANYGFSGASFTGDCTMLEYGFFGSGASFGSYGNTTGGQRSASDPSGVNAFGLKNDTLSSIKVSDYPVRLFRDVLFKNACTDISSSAATLGGCNDLTSSISIVPLPRDVF